MPTTSEALPVLAVLASAGAGAAIDLRTGRIPNLITVSTALAGIAAAAAGFSGFGMKASLVGFALGALAMMPGHVLGATGAGDVKLLAALGTWLGPVSIVRAFVYTTLAGGALALGFALWRGRLRTTLRSTGRLMAAPVVARQEIESPTAGNRFPYGPAIAAGAILVALGF